VIEPPVAGFCREESVRAWLLTPLSQDDIPWIDSSLEQGSLPISEELDIL
jgi:hypothetical protein